MKLVVIKDEAFKILNEDIIHVKGTHKSVQVKTYIFG